MMNNYLTKLVMFSMLLLSISMACKTNPLEKKAEFTSPGQSDIKVDYLKEAVKVFYDGTFASGRDNILEYNQLHPISVQSYEIDTLIEANRRRGIEYEMSEISSKTNERFKQIIIWQNTDSIRYRSFEHIVKMDKSITEEFSIEKRRNQWIELCNQHNAENLIHELYSANTLYYNHKPLIVGRELLTKEYSYMNNDRYSLSLSPIITKQVTKNCVFEIGQCSGSYNGKYIIVWRKDFSGKWEVFIDSNI